MNENALETITTEKPKARRGRQKVKTKAAMPELLRTRLLLRVKEYSELSGTPVSTIYALIKVKKIAHVKTGDSIRIPASALKVA